MILGKAIFDRVSIPCPLNRTILRQIADQPVYLADFYSYDQKVIINNIKIYASYHSMLVNTNAEEIGLNFCLYVNDF